MKHKEWKAIWWLSRNFVFQIWANCWQKSYWVWSQIIEVPRVELCHLFTCQNACTKDTIRRVNKCSSPSNSRLPGRAQCWGGSSYEASQCCSEIGVRFWGWWELVEPASQQLPGLSKHPDTPIRHEWANARRGSIMSLRGRSCMQIFRLWKRWSIGVRHCEICNKPFRLIISEYDLWGAAISKRQSCRWLPVKAHPFTGKRCFCSIFQIWSR